MTYEEYTMYDDEPIFTEEEIEEAYPEALCDLTGLCDGRACPYYQNCKGQVKG